jgi:hypothetical protein
MRNRLLCWLILGDLVTLFLITVVGFASHQELGSAGWRLLTTFVPLCVGWALSAPGLGLYRHDVYARPAHIWKSLWGMLLAGPIAALLRGIWLNRPIIPVFGIVLTGSAMLGMFLWRLLFWLLIARRIRDG